MVIANEVSKPGCLRAVHTLLQLLTSLYLEHDGMMGLQV